MLNGLIDSKACKLSNEEICKSFILDSISIGIPTKGFSTGQRGWRIMVKPNQQVKNYFKNLVFGSAGKSGYVQEIQAPVIPDSRQRSSASLSQNRDFLTSRFHK